MSARTFAQPKKAAFTPIPAQRSAARQHAAAPPVKTGRLSHDFSQISIYPAPSDMLQTKLTIGQPGDKYEQEADRVAEQAERL